MQRRSPTLTILFVAVTALGVVATLAAIGIERRNADERAERAVELAATRLGGELQRTVSALRGAGALATDGNVLPEAFDAFASDVLEDSLYRALALTEIVPGTARERFESSSGLEIVDTDGAGGLVPAADRDRHFVVVQVAPMTELTSGILGFDIASEPARRRAAEAALARPGPVVSDPIRLASSARPGLFVIHDVTPANGDAVGFVSSGLAMEDLIAAADVPAERLGLALDGIPLYGAIEGSRRDLDVAGRTFTVWLDTDISANWVTPLLIGCATAALITAGVVFAQRDARQTRRLQHVAARDRSMAQLGEQLSRATTPAEVVEATIAVSGDLVGATSSAIVLVGDDHLRCRPDGETWWIEIPSPLLAVTVRTDVTRYASGSTPAEWTVAERAGVRSGLAVPLCASNGAVLGSLGFAWTTALDSLELVRREDVARTLSELVSGALERSQFGEVVTTAAAGLASIAEQLATANTSDAVRQILTAEVAPTIRAVRSLVVDELERPPTWPPSTLHARIGSPASGPALLLVADLGDVAGPLDAQQDILETIADLAEQTLQRIEHTEQEHRLVLELQRDVLTNPPPIDSIDLAVGYEPAMDAVGLGGDFYDVVVSDDGRINLIIGDVAGHGPEAVVVMAQLQAVMHELLHAGVEPAAVLAQADAHLARRRFVATAQIAQIDPTARTMTLVNAGHPFPVLRTASRIEIVRDGHRPLLGLATDPEPPTPTPRRLEPGDVLVLYTDGLVEVRGETIDDAVNRMCALVHRATAVTSAGLVEHLLTSTTSLRPGSDRSDDVAVIVVRAEENAGVRAE